MVLGLYSYLATMKLYSIFWIKFITDYNVKRYYEYFYKTNIRFLFKKNVFDDYYIFHRKTGEKRKNKLTF